jgi:predicted phosphodiesterase
MDHEDMEIQVAEDADYLLIAGDIGGHQYIDRIHKVADQYKKVYLVMGNHDYYNKYKTYRDMAKKFHNKTKDTNIHFLDMSSDSNDDFTIRGATLWTNMDEGNPLAANRLRHSFPDFKYINWRKEKGQRPEVFTPENSLRLHEMEVEYLETFDDPAGKPIITMTHHIPSTLLADKKWNGNPWNPAFSSDGLDHIIESSDVWVYGHTHDPYDAEFLGCRMVCNPRGYPFENNGFDPIKVIEI